MPKIALLKIHKFRNLQEIAIVPSSGFNFFFGLNGSGKTSLLESIYFLGVKRSFRTHLNRRLVQHTTDSFTIFTTIEEKKQLTSIGIEQYRSGDCRLKINGKEIFHWAILAKQLPLCLLGITSHRFLLDGPKIRRQFLDWLLFHIEPNFFPIWKRFHRLLKQRNAALKLRLPFDEITQWDQMLYEDAQQIHMLRKDIISEFSIIFVRVLKHFLPNIIILPSYYPGWQAKQSLLQQLRSNFKMDLQRGYTQIGPQRADFRLLIRELPAQDVLSQGQQKLVTYALYLSKGLFFQGKTKISPIYLIDDLVAELDIKKRRRVIDLLTQLQSQVFVTGTSAQEIIIPNSSVVFHVKHGSIYPAKFVCST
ncbi:DNA replication/repair protein RecF [Coxiella endosymbiont of Amblyomma americanum]|uniref:DNA replication/repair protein RecF n=1 Tax=Coxiella endosymbiont of Amblyomma americanum TaxID=325775 RepID=UPI00057F7E6F|nr:DNA replication/repair protein RecF [Coxiella endosymbiont of Amblyomma americanum]AJC50147.1 DNA recombination protein RecF [Coxiella endosymbiont of Amblyomma americanum]